MIDAVKIVIIQNGVVIQKIEDNNPQRAFIKAFNFGKRKFGFDGHKSRR